MLSTNLSRIPLLLTLACTLSVNVPAAAQSTTTVQAFLDRLDRVRATASIPLLRQDPALATVASDLASGIAAGAISLTDPTANTNVIERAAGRGYAARALSVLLAAGARTDEAAMSEWLSSEGNAASLLSTRFQHIGVVRVDVAVPTPNGSAQPLWIAILGEPLEQPVADAAPRLLDAVIAHRRGRGLPAVTTSGAGPGRQRTCRRPCPAKHARPLGRARTGSARPARYRGLPDRAGRGEPGSRAIRSKRRGGGMGRERRPPAQSRSQRRHASGHRLRPERPAAEWSSYAGCLGADSGPSEPVGVRHVQTGRYRVRDAAASSRRAIPSANQARSGVRSTEVATRTASGSED